MREIAITILTVGAIGVAGLAPTGLQAAPYSSTASFRSEGSRIMLNPQPLPPKANVERVSKSAPNTQFVVPQNVRTNPFAGGTMNEFQKAQNGGLSGVGVPGSLGGSGDVGAGIKKRAGAGKDADLGGIMPSGSMGKAKKDAGGIKGSQGQAQGREAKDGVSARQMEGMQAAIGQAAKTQGQNKGVEAKEGATARQSEQIIKAIGEAADSRGKETGVEAKEGGGKLSKQQRQAMKSMTFDPKVNPHLGSRDEGDGKGGGKAGGGKSGGGKVGGMTPAQRDKEKKEIAKVFKGFEKPKTVTDKKTGAIMSNIVNNKAGTIVFPNQKIVGKVPKPPEPKTDGSNQYN
jgi:hypothetical protein